MEEFEARRGEVLKCLKHDSSAPVGYDLEDPRFADLYEALELLNLRMMMMRWI
jgi:hypothetical protein